MWGKEKMGLVQRGQEKNRKERGNLREKNSRG